MNYDLTDLGNAKRYADIFQETMRFVHERKEWFFWNDSKWGPDDTGIAVRNIDTLLQAIWRDAKEANSEKHFKWHSASQMGGRINSTLKLARSMPNMSQSYRTFDSKGHYLGVKNGVIDLRDGRFITDDPKYLITKETGFTYDPTAQCPQWVQFLSTITEHDEDIVSFLHRLAGQALLGTQGNDKLTILYGAGANGKSTFIDTLKDVFGDYAKVTDPRVILQGQSNAEYYLAALSGVRLLLMSETKRGVALAEDIVKKIVDSGEITGRFPYGRVFQYQPLFTPVLCTNHKPRVSNDYAIWRRLLLVPFNHVIPENQKNPKFRTEVLHAEASGILNWCIEGCRRFQDRGLAPSDSIIAATAAYRDEQDKLGQFIEQCCEVDHCDKKVRVEITTLRNIYEEWCRNEGLRAEGNISLKAELMGRGYEVKKGGNGRVVVHGLSMYRDATTWRDLEIKLKKRHALKAVS